jgi:hypothetical protein
LSQTNEKPTTKPTKVKGVLSMTAKKVSQSITMDGQPIDQTEIKPTDTVIVTKYPKDTLDGEHILIVDRNQRKSKEFLNAIDEVMKDFARMYGFSADDEETPETTTTVSTGYEEELEPQDSNESTRTRDQTNTLVNRRGHAKNN